MSFHHGVRITTARSIAAIEDICEHVCKGAFDVRVAGLSDDLRKKSLDVYFQSDEDLTAFKTAFRNQSKAG
ncbi:MAG: hypothetical protein K9H25_23015 [Rhodospirillum sp.]|nr:hypothetical protein [Rhodospirillum sp.]MCF8489130.1 hypothetical protein [Rhodospirillum sp.]MCF8498920.1 hypothetical protein [Rhodospirillum sp.]